MIRMDVIGHIGQDAIVRDVTGSSLKAIGFSVAHSEKYKDAQGVQHERTTWVNCTLWRQSDKLAIVPYLMKGQKVFVTGQPSAAGYIAKNSSQPSGDLRLKVDSIELLGAANNNPQQGTYNGGQQAQPAQYSQQQSVSTPAGQIPDNNYSDDLPF